MAGWHTLQVQFCVGQLVGAGCGHNATPDSLQLRLLCKSFPTGLRRVGPLVEQPLSEVEEVLQTNVLGVVRVTQASTAAMCKSRCWCRCRRRGQTNALGIVRATQASIFATCAAAAAAAVCAAAGSEGQTSVARHAGKHCCHAYSYGCCGCFLCRCWC